MEYSKPKLQQTCHNLDYGCWSGNGDNDPAGCGRGAGRAGY